MVVNITVRLDKASVKFLDTLGQSLGRGRSYLIKDAAESYISMHESKNERINTAITGLESVEFVADKKLEKLIRKGRR
jgi:predicted transcriptional regulator